MIILFVTFLIYSVTKFFLLVSLLSSKFLQFDLLIFDWMFYFRLISAQLLWVSQSHFIISLFRSHDQTAFYQFVIAIASLCLSNFTFIFNLRLCHFIYREFHTHLMLNLMIQSVSFALICDFTFELFCSSVHNCHLIVHLF